MSEAAKKPFDPNEFIVETDRMMKEAKKKKEFDPDEFIRETDALLQPQGTNKTGGFAVGLAEAYNPLSLIRPTETFGREILNTKTEMVPDPHGGITFRPVNAEEARAKAEKDTVTPDLSVRNILSKIGAKDFVSNLNPSAEKAGMLTGTALSLGEGGLKLIGKPGMFSKLTKEGQLLSKEAKAAQAGKEYELAASEILGETDPKQIQHIRENVNRIEELVQDGRNNGAGLEVAQKIRTELKAAETKLGEAVDQVKNLVFSDTKTQIPMQPFQKRLNTLLNQKGALSTGEATLTGKEAKDIATVQEWLSKPSRNPSDTLKIAEKIWGMIQPDRVAKDNISGEAVYVLKQTYHDLKTELHKRFPGYAEVDAPYSEFKDHVSNIERKIKGSNGESYVKNLFNMGKTEARQDLDAALSVLHGKTGAQHHFKEIRSLNVANDIIGKGDIRLDQNDRTKLKYIDEYLTKAGNIGTGAGILGGSLMGGSSFGPFGAVLGGGAAGDWFGRIAKNLSKPLAVRYGNEMADAQRIFDAARTANNLSSEAKQLALEIEKMSSVRGAIEKALPYLATLPAYKELTKFAQSQQESTK